MPVYPPNWEPLRASGRYRHMFKHDIAIWERFLDAYGEAFTEVAYDIALGGVTPNDPTATEAEAKMWQYSTAKKIDAVVQNDAEAWICECRPQAGLSAVGQVVGYAILGERDPFTSRPVVMTIVTDQMDGDTKLVCQELEIQVIELPEIIERPPEPPVLDLGELTP